MRVAVIGPGRIGCGFVGQLLHGAGHEVCFIGRRPTITRLGRAGGYTVRLVDGRVCRTLPVLGVTAVDAAEFDRAAAVIASADLVATAVGAASLASIALLLAHGLAACVRPVRVIAFENAGNAGHLLHRLVISATGDLSLERHRFSGAVVSRVVSTRRFDPDTGELVVVGDPPDWFTVDRAALGPGTEGFPGMVLTDNYRAAVERKLYTYSLGHAAAAYLGFLKGYHYIHSAIRDPEIRDAVLAAMTEGQAAVDARHGAGAGGDRDDLLAILHRFENPALNDTIQRVGRDAKRKLAANERLVGAVRLALAAGASPVQLPMVVAAALHYVDRLDPSASALHRDIAANGIGPVLDAVCQFDPDERFRSDVVNWWQHFGRDWAEDLPLFTLNGAGAHPGPGVALSG